ncbi:type II methionyl aminopeptidase [Candidatus Micrarchaeota archaeon]|nr:type II methionyl aminopeptidase [Candidatus Micrarchaeota archaeon]
MEGFEEELKNYLKAGEIAAGVKAFARAETKPGVKLLELAEKIEAKIRELGAQPAFPTNLSRNDEAAHFTPCAGDVCFVGEKDVLKVDFGCHVEGCIADVAFTVDFSGEHADLIEASDAALEAALSKIKAGVSVSEVGKAIAFEIRGRGYEPISNLCGHSLLPYVLHAGEEIPNIETGSYVLQEGDFFAVEPFATTGKGRVSDSDFLQIYSMVGEKKVRLPSSRALAEYAGEEYKLLPFAVRWLAPKFDVSSTQFKLAVADLVRQEVIYPYHGLRESTGGVVSQSETTVVVEENGCKPLVPTKQ